MRKLDPTGVNINYLPEKGISPHFIVSNPVWTLFWGLERGIGGGRRPVWRRRVWASCQFHSSLCPTHSPAIPLPLPPFLPQPPLPASVTKGTPKTPQQIFSFRHASFSSSYPCQSVRRWYFLASPRTFIHWLLLSQFFLNFLRFSSTFSVFPKCIFPECI